ncbi:MAG TPA: hypothetical protein VKV40_17745 [Ktedonobacteraceae bacterium]|nr:hypothetical protein [Ktedonobacteraceae bacterium]
MWSNSKVRKTLIIVVCFLVVAIAVCGNIIGSRVVDAKQTAASHTHLASSSSSGAKSAATFTVTSIDMYVTPSSVSLWKCGSYIQVTYNAVFHVVSGPNGGTIDFSYTINNGRGQTNEKLTIIPGQYLSNFTFTWQGSLPSDHTYPEPGGVLVTSPNTIESALIAPAGKCG